jgi:hypothetical protein
LIIYAIIWQQQNKLIGTFSDSNIAFQFAHDQSMLNAGETFLVVASVLGELDQPSKILGFYTCGHFTAVTIQF